MLKKILDRLLPKREKDRIITEAELTNQILLNELVDHLREEIVKLSVGTRMLYPMSFKVLMHQDDYNNLKEAFPFVVPEVVKGFYSVIKSMKDTFPNYIPVAKDWVFQFSSCQLSDVSLSDGKDVFVKKGHITTLASLMAEDLTQRNTSVTTNTRVSVKVQNSNVMREMNINWDAISSIDIIGDNYFRCKFDPSLDGQKVGENIVVTDEKALAVLSYSKEGRTYTFTMLDNQIDICGAQGSEGRTEVFRIDNKRLLAPHVQIKYIPDQNKFQIAAYGKTRLSGRELDISQQGMIKWFALANNSSIFMNDEVSVKFEIK